MHADGNREHSGQADKVLEDAGDIGVEELDPLYLLFGGAMRVEGMPDEVPVHAKVNECLLEVKKGHVYWLVLLPVPLQQQPDSMDRISSPASSNKITLIETVGDDFPETGIDYAISYKIL